MLTLVLKTGDLACLIASYEEKKSLIEAVEIRLDLLSLNLEQIAILRKKISHTVLFTDKWEYLSSEKKAFILSYLSLAPNYVDFDQGIEKAFWLECREKFPKIRWILSYHNYQKTPENLSQIFEGLQRKNPNLIKVACHCKSALDAVRMWEEALKIPSSERIVISMGRKGRWLRSLSSVLANPFIYVASSEKEKAYGQFSLQEWLKKRLDQLVPQTRIYALLGASVFQSIGDLFHNAQFPPKKSYYVKISLQEKELFPFLEKAKTLNFAGFSVTMPLKEKAYFYCKKERTLVTDLPVNTLKKIQGKFYGYNTDASSALELIEENGLQKLPLVILGTGGVSQAIGFFAKEKGYKVVFLGRNLKTLKTLEKQGFQVFSFFEKIPPISKAVLINGTPIGRDRKTLPVPKSFFSSEWTVFELIYTPRKTPLLQKAKEKKCLVIPGKSLFIRQAEKQQEIWFAKNKAE